MLLVESVADAETVAVPDPARLAYSTQTTLSLADTAAIVAVLRRRFPAIEGPRNEDICYATTNRQKAVAAIAPRAELFLVVGAANSSNSVRLVEVARSAAAARARAGAATSADIDWAWLDGVRTLGLSAGASAPELLVEQVVARLPRALAVTVEEVRVAEETRHLPLAADPAGAPGLLSRWPSIPRCRSRRCWRFLADYELGAPAGVRAASPKGSRTPTSASPPSAAATS